MKEIEILKRLNELNYDKNDYWVLAGAAMVLYGIKPNTPDIDLGCNKKMADALSCKYEPIFLPDGTRRFRIDKNVEIFENWLSGEIEYLKGIPIVSITGLITMKKELGREKDMKDIALINEYLESKRVNRKCN